MKQIVVYPRGQLEPKDRERLTKAGFVVVEADDPGAIVTVVPGAPLASADDLLLAALAAITGDSASVGVQAQFARALAQRIRKNSEAKQAAQESESQTHKA
jgi:hypothetical protein